MTVGPAVLRSQSVPYLSVACAAIAAFFGVQAIIVDRWMMVLSLVLATIFGLGALWYWLRSRRSAVLIDRATFTVKAGRRQRSFEIADIEKVDLGARSGHVRFKDGSTVTLPLEGRQLVEAGLLLEPRRPPRRSS